MSDHELGMNMVEEEETLLFLEAYEASTGTRLEIEVRAERPDFICRREAVGPIGVELTRVMRDPESAHWDRVLRGREFMEAYDASDLLYATLECKEAKRRSGVWLLRDRTILVLQLIDCPLSEVAPILDDIGPEDFSSHGFHEVWISDQSELDAYSQVELYCLYPEHLWGYYPRDRGKPYG